MGDTLPDREPSYVVKRYSNRSRDLFTSLDRLGRTIAGLRRRTILFASWGVIMVAATAVRIIAELRWS